MTQTEELEAMRSKRDAAADELAESEKEAAVDIGLQYDAMEQTDDPQEVERIGNEIAAIRDHVNRCRASLSALERSVYELERNPPSKEPEA